MVSYRENVAHKYSRARSSEVSHPFKYSLPGSVINHLRVDNMTALSYLLNLGGTQSEELIKISKQIWSYLLEKQICMTVEYVPSIDNHLADWESRNFQDRSEWKLCPMSFKIICKKFGTPLVDLFASRLCHQHPRYMSWRPDPQSIATDALHQDWKNQFCYAFPPFSLIGRVLRKVQKDQTKLIIVTPAWQSQSWYPTLLKMAIADPFLLPKHQKILLNPEGKIHPLVQNSTLRLVAWLVSGKTYLQREYQKGLLTLSQIPEGKVLSSQL